MSVFLVCAAALLAPVAARKTFCVEITPGATTLAVPSGVRVNDEVIFKNLGCGAVTLETGPGAPFAISAPLAPRSSFVFDARSPGQWPLRAGALAGAVNVAYGSAPQTHTLKLTATGFEPLDLVVRQGDKVVVDVVAAGQHSVTSVADGANPDGYWFDRTYTQPGQAPNLDLLNGNHMVVTIRFKDKFAADGPISSIKIEAAPDERPAGAVGCTATQACNGEPIGNIGMGGSGGENNGGGGGENNGGGGGENNGGGGGENNAGDNGKDIPVTMGVECDPDEPACDNDGIEGASSFKSCMAAKGVEITNSMSCDEWNVFIECTRGIRCQCRQFASGQCWVATGFSLCGDSVDCNAGLAGSASRAAPLSSALLALIVLFKLTE